MRVSHKFTADSARFDEDNLVSYAGLVPLLGLAQQTGLSEIIADKVHGQLGKAALVASRAAPRQQIATRPEVRASVIPAAFDEVGRGRPVVGLLQQR